MCKEIVAPPLRGDDAFANAETDPFAGPPLGAYRPRNIGPSYRTWITSSLPTSSGFALVGAVVGELLGSAQGLVLQTVDQNRCKW